MKHIVGIAGLGLIGASLAKAIKAKTDCTVLGYDINSAITDQAMGQKAIDDMLCDANLAECSIVICALYPESVIDYCKNILAKMQKGAILVDCAGVKTSICEELSPFAAKHSVCFVGGHPMAGIEASGFSASFAELFEGAVMILCRDEYTCKNALETLSGFFLSIGFGSIKISDAKEHDEIIAYTSQLAHAVSCAFMHNGTAKRRLGFSAGSFKDLTRVARLNENLWTGLFFENKENLLMETDAFLEQMHSFREALASGNRDAIRAMLKNGTALKILDEEEEAQWRIR